MDIATTAAIIIGENDADADVVINGLTLCVLVCWPIVCEYFFFEAKHYMYAGVNIDK